MTCPLCQKEIDQPAAECPRCRADVSLLVEHAAEVKAACERTDSHPRAAEVAAAIRTHLERLSVDPADDEAYAALEPVIASLRASTSGSSSRWLAVMVTIAVAGVAFLLGVACGMMFRIEGYANV
jgi:hypothetical protein